MRAISLWEPWASAIARGLKSIETRGWSTNFRGRIAIHAAKTRDHSGFILDPEVKDYFRSVGIHSAADLPFGCVVATAELIACRRTEDLVAKVSPMELAMGNYEPGRFGWMLANVERLATPMPARGSQGFWNWEVAA